MSERSSSISEYSTYEASAWMRMAPGDKNIESHLEYLKLLEGFVIPNVKSAVCIGDGRCGLESRHLANKGIVAYPLDFAAPGIRFAKKWNLITGGVEADGCKLPIKDQSVDMVFIKESLHHMQKPFECLYEAVRVAKVMVAIVEPLLTSQVIFEGVTFMHTFSEWDLVRVAGGCGWNFVAYRYCPHYPMVAAGLIKDNSEPVLLGIMSKDIAPNNLPGFNQTQIVDRSQFRRI